MSSEARASKEILLTGRRLIEELSKPQPKFFLLEEAMQKALITVFTELKYLEVTREISNLPEIEDYYLKEEIPTE